MRIIFFTDVHLLENKDSIPGFRACLDAMLAQKPDVLIHGGDLGITPEAVTTYRTLMAPVPVPAYQVNGNHEMCNRSLPREKAGQFCQSFDRGCVHFVILDVVRYIEPSPERPWNWHVIADAANLRWLEADLKSVSCDTPVILASHVPLSTSFPFRFGQGLGVPWPTNEVVNAEKVLARLEPFRSVATLHGHDHENCRHSWKHIQILTTAAVAGNWWKNGLDSPNTCGEPQGFRVVDISERDGEIRSRYVAIRRDQDRPAAIHIDQVSGRRFVNVFDGSPKTKVFGDRLGPLMPLDPLAESSKRLSPHMYELPGTLPGRVLDLTIGWEDGSTQEVAIEIPA